MATAYARIDDTAPVRCLSRLASFSSSIILPTQSDQLPGQVFEGWKSSILLLLVQILLVLCARPCVPRTPVLRPVRCACGTYLLSGSLCWLKWWNAADILSLLVWVFWHGVRKVAYSSRFRSNAVEKFISNYSCCRLVPLQRVSLIIPSISSLSSRTWVHILVLVRFFAMTFR